MFLFCSGYGMGNSMDWDLAIKRNSKALKGIIDVLFALLGLDGTGAAERIPRSLHSAVLRVCGPLNPPCAALLSLRPGALW